MALELGVGVIDADKMDIYMSEKHFIDMKKGYRMYIDVMDILIIISL